VENASLVSKIAIDDNRPSTTSATGQTTSDFSAQEGISAQSAQNVSSRCGPFIREATYLQGLSPGVIDIILESWKKSTKQQYWTYFQKWKNFCLQRGIDPLLTPVPLVLDFLLALFNSGLGYSALNTARGALSAISSDRVGSNVLVNRFMKGVFHKRPSLPRYHVTWDVSIVLDYLKTLPSNNKLSLKLLSGKLVMLMALLSGQRGQTLHIMKLDDVNITNEHVTVQITSLLKQSRPTKHLNVVKIPGFSKDRRLCVVTVFKEYLHHLQMVERNFATGRNQHTNLQTSQYKDGSHIKGCGAACTCQHRDSHCGMEQRLHI